MSSIQLPSIPVPAGQEANAAKLLRGIKGLFQFTSEPEVVPDAGIRSMTAAIENALNEGAAQADFLASAAKRRKKDD